MEKSCPFSICDMKKGGVLLSSALETTLQMGDTAYGVVRSTTTTEITTTTTTPTTTTTVFGGSWSVLLPFVIESVHFSSRQFFR